MKNYSSIILAVLGTSFSLGVHAQTVTVKDKSSLQPVQGVNVFSARDQVFRKTGADGKTDISSLKDADSIAFQRLGYQTMKFTPAQLEAMKYVIMLQEKAYNMDVTVTSASRFAEKRSDVAQQVEVISRSEMELMNQPTMAEVLQQSGQVLVQKSQQGGGSPIIRGFEANRVLMVVDGVRMNNAIYRAGHLQNVITMDNSILDRTEIVYGPGSVMYGSDALGGVMHFYTRNPLLADSGKRFQTGGNAYVRYATANEGMTGHADLNLGWGKVASLTSFTYSDFGDLRQGANRNPFYGDWGKRSFHVERINGKDSMIANSDVNVQSPSGYKQYDFLQKVMFQPSKYVSHVLNFQYSTSSDIPRYDRLNEIRNGKPRSAQWYYGPQERLLGAYTMNIANKGGIIDNARFTVAYQNVGESRHDRNFGSTTLNHRTEQVDVFSLNLDLDRRIGKHELRYGVEGFYNIVNSSAYGENVDNGQRKTINTRYPDGGSVMQTYAAYLTDAWELNRMFIVNAGVRYNYVDLVNKFSPESFYKLSIGENHNQFDALNGNLGLVVKPGSGWRITAVGSTGFRAPNVDDMAKFFDNSSAGATVLVPNPDLGAEYVYSGELGITKEINKRVKLEAVGYYSRFTDFITVAPFQFEGKDSIVYDGKMSQTVSNVNADMGYVYGASGSVNADITSEFSVSSALTYTYGRINLNDEIIPLDHVPPIYGRTGFKLNKKRFQGELFFLYNGWKRIEDFRLKAEDNEVYATEHGMPAWMTVNVRGSYSISSNLRLQASLENILDTNYRMFASGISAPGRNLIVTLRGTF